MVALFISVVVGMVVAFGTASLFFRDGDDATECMREYARPFSRYTNPWGGRFGLWLSVSTGAGVLVYCVLQAVFPALAFH